MGASHGVSLGVLVKKHYYTSTSFLKVVVKKRAGWLRFAWGDLTEGTLLVPTIIRSFLWLWIHLSPEFERISRFPRKDHQLIRV
jgi:hypothetical protein